ncbi:MAG: glycerophosphodiester phosphodiesterase family protein, partial [Bacillota bacterium]
MNYCRNIAHRGASAYAPENTMASFELALGLGADAIELDVQLTKDEKLVVIHDLSIDRTSNGTGYIKDMTLDDLRQFDFSYKFKDQYEPGKCIIPELEDVLIFAKENNLYINIETKDYSKPYGKVNYLTAQLIRTYEYAENTLISSINHNAMALLKQEFPEIPTAIAFFTDFYNLSFYAKNCNTNALNPIYYLVDEEFMKMADESGLEVNPWTVTEKDEIARLKKLGV